MVQKVMFTAGTMSATSLHLIVGAPVAHGKSILLYSSVEFLKIPGDSAAVVHSCVDPYPTVVVGIRLITMYHV